MILVLNMGSSSLKAAVFDNGLAILAQGGVSEIGGAGTLSLNGRAAPCACQSHASALESWLAALTATGADLSALRIVAHRVVHGGADLTTAQPLSPALRDRIAQLSDLAPLHNPPALAGMDAAATRWPDLPQIAVFDTAFHATQAPVDTTYPLPASLREAGLRRYGFHGISYAGLVRSLGPDLPPRLLAFHIGAGVSACAIRDGQSAATTMGYSPLSGTPMGTRSGDIDPALVLRLARDLGIEGAEQILWRESGLSALSGIGPDMQRIEAAGTPEAEFAIDHFCQWIARQAAGLIPAMGGVDAFAFTGGIGENSDRVRSGILDRLAWLGDLPVHIVRADEERTIARAALDALGNAP